MNYLWGEISCVKIVDSENMKRFLSVLAIVVFLFTVSLNTNVLAQGVDGSQFKVDHVAGLFEKIGEKFSLWLKFNNNDKADYYESLLNKRLGEIQFVIENGNGDLIEETSSRYSTYLAVMSNFIISNKLSDRKNQIAGILDRHLKVLQTQQSNFEFESGWWLLLQHDINLVNSYRDKINNL